MAKKIKFPLEVANGVKARSIEELRENFDVELIIIYYKNGKLVTWLEDRYYDKEVEKIIELKISDVDFLKKLCEIFEVEYVSEVNGEEIIRKARRIAKLKQYTEELEIIQHIEKVVFNQEELSDLLDEKEKKIYLCGEEFSISLRMEGIEYIGVNNPVVFIKSKKIVNFEEKKIGFKNVRFNSEYKILIEHMEKNSEKKFEEYVASELLGYKLSNREIERSRENFNKINKELANCKIDLYKKSKDIKNEISELSNIRTEFLQRFK